MIYVIGNSHCHVFTSSTPSTIGEGEHQNKYFRSFSLGPTLAYNFYEHHFPPMINIINELPITTDDYILIAIGEVDCRWHIPFQAAKQNRNPIDVVHECIDRFFRTHLHLKENGYQVIGWGGHPSTISGHCDVGDVVYGDCLTRNKISMEWNNYLNLKCKENNILFISILEKLICSDGLSNMNYFKDYCHLDPDKVLPLIIQEFKYKNLI